MIFLSKRTQEILGEFSDNFQKNSKLMRERWEKFVKNIYPCQIFESSLANSRKMFVKLIFLA